ncbi:rhomboid family intramembrane serine protease [Klebsiella aerogenes]|nr:rhomboid family intramembrane serine protease [Klebsiella aerogenes]
MSSSHVESSSLAPVRTPFVTLILIGLNVAWFCYLSHFFTRTDFNHTTLVHQGANIAQLTLTGEPWRLVVSLFLHGSFSHLLLNMVALGAIGVYAEKLLGRWRMVVVYFLAGVFGSLVSASYALGGYSPEGRSLIYHMFSALQVVISLGASGAIMGLAGAAIVAHIIAPSYTQSKNDLRALYSILGMVVLTLLYGMREGVDNASHIGGLCAGVAIGFVMALLGRRKKWLTEALLLCGGCLLLLVGTWIAQQQVSEPDLKIRENLRNEFYPLSVEKERQQKRQALADERVAHMEKWPEPVSYEEARGAILAEIPGIQDMVISHDGRTLYAAVEDKNTITVYSLEQHKTLRTITGPVPAKNEKGRSLSGVRALKLSPDETLLYATGFEADSLSVIRVATGEIVQTIATGRGPDALVISRDGKRAWVMNRIGNSITAINLETYKPTGTTPLEQYDGFTRDNYKISPLALSSDEKTLLASGMNRSKIVRIDADTLQKVDYPAGNTDGNTYVFGFRPETGDVILADSLGIARIERKSQQSKRLSQWCNYDRYSIEAISPDSRYIALSSNRLSGIVVVINVDAGQAVGAYPTDGIRQIRFSADGKRIYVLGENALTELDRQKSLSLRDSSRREMYGDVTCLPNVD